MRASLFPIGPRQEADLTALAPGSSPADTFAAVHAGVAAALAAHVETFAPAARVAAWLRLEDQPDAAALLWAASPDRVVSARIARDFTARSAEGSLGDAYQRTVTPDLRHRLGEHYTPDWLVRRIAHRYAGHGTVADPSCGDGRFLVALLDAGHDPADLWGGDLNPLAVLLARIAVWTRLGRPDRVPPTDIMWRDFILAGPARDTDVFVGNPPWVTWRNLSESYRGALADRMSGSTLNHTRGWSARVAAGQTDLSHVFLHEAAERVTRGGRIAFVLPRAVFKAPVGPGPVRTGVATSGRRYRFDEVWDCAGADPFTGVRMESVVAFVSVDEPHRFPVPWHEVHPDTTHDGTVVARGRPAPVPRDPAETRAVLSDPDDPASAWLCGAEPLRLATGDRWPLRARGGINTGGGNSAFHVELLERRGDRVLVRSVPGRRSATEPVTAEIEATFVRPLLKGRDVRPFHARAGCHIVLPHRVDDLRKPLAEAELLRVAPDTYAYLDRFRSLLAGRPELARWPSTSWFQVFRIGPYTSGCFRVVWPTSANGALRAAVLDRDDPTVPDQKVVLVPFDEPDPAWFLAALLNSPTVRAAAAASAGLDASPNLVTRIPLPRYDAAAHRHIVALTRASATPGAVAEADREITKLFR